MSPNSLRVSRTGLPHIFRIASDLYVCVPRSFLSLCTSAGVDREVDLSISRLDHLATCAVLEGCAPEKQEGFCRWAKHRSQLVGLNDPDKLEQAREVLKNFRGVPWVVDVHTHCGRILRAAWDVAETLSGPGKLPSADDWIRGDTLRVAVMKRQLNSVYRLAV